MTFSQISSHCARNWPLLLWSKFSGFILYNSDDFMLIQSLLSLITILHDLIAANIRLIYHRIKVLILSLEVWLNPSMLLSRHVVLSTIGLQVDIDFLSMYWTTSNATRLTSIQYLSLTFSLSLKYCSLDFSGWMSFMCLTHLYLFNDSRFLLVRFRILVLVDHMVVRIVSTVLWIVILFNLLFIRSYWLEAIPL